MSRPPSLGQMVNRSNAGHLAALRAFSRQGHLDARPNITMGELRGWRIVVATLARWECTSTAKEGEIREQIGLDAYHIIKRGQWVTRLTSRGQELFAALEARQ